jgi:hypothetical protein
LTLGIRVGIVEVMKPAGLSKKRSYAVFLAVMVLAVVGMLTYVLVKYPLNKDQPGLDSTYRLPVKQNPAVAPVPVAE